MNYEESMQYGEGQYADVLKALASEGFPATFIQTGGMCAAIEIRLEGGRYVLVTDAEDTLAWERSEHAGWGVGIYGPSEYDDEPLAYTSTEHGEVEALLPVVRQVLGDSIAS